MNSVIFGAFDLYYKKAEEEKINDNLKEAKRLYLLAARSLLEVSLTCQGELQRALVDRADRIHDYAESLLREESSSAPTKSNTQPTKAEAKSSSTSPESDNTETKFVAAEIPDISFDDVAGLEDVKESIRRRVINPSKHPEVFAKFNKRTGGGVLMYGLPGTGKTMIAKAIAHEANAKFFSIRCSDIVSKWFGEAEKNIKELFSTARKEKCSVIFFDEFESLAAKRSSGSTVMPRLVAEFLSQIQGFSESENTLLLLAATNRPWDIDSAFLRSGRFDELIYIPLPDFEARKHIIVSRFEAIPTEDGIDFDRIALETEGFNGADISEFCDRCVDFVVERCVKNGGNTDGQMVTKKDINETLENFGSSVQKKDIDKLEKFKEEFVS